MNQTLASICLALVCYSCGSPPEPTSLQVVRQAGEFETQDAIWLIWPANDHKAGESVEKVMISVIEALIGDQQIVVTCRDQALFDQASKVMKTHFGEPANLVIRQLPSYEIWARDMGPVFVETNQHTLAIADFNFNSWGYADTLAVDTKTEEMYDVRVAEQLKLAVVSSRMVSEGGNRELNGKGTMLTTEFVEGTRNPEMSKVEMEAEYLRLLGVKKTIWLKQGLVEDDHTFLGPILTADSTKAYTLVTTNGHIDEFARFVNDSTILFASVDTADLADPIALENHKRLEENYRILLESTDQDGQPFHIVRMPLSGTTFSTMHPGDYVYEYIKTLDYLDGSTFPEGDSIKVIAAHSYLNFIIANKVIIGQSCWRAGMPLELKEKDKTAAEVLQSVFPNRKVVMIDALAVNLGGGGLHCMSMQQPAYRLPPE